MSQITWDCLSIEAWKEIYLLGPEEPPSGTRDEKACLPPRLEGGWAIPEDEIIPGHLDAPGHEYDYHHEEGFLQLTFEAL